MSTATRARDIGECRACGKIRYITRDQARHAARIIGAKFGTRMRAYECAGYWHISSMPARDVAALRSGGDRDGKCALCGKPACRSADEARALAEAMTKAGDGYWYAADCGESWHLRRFRWSGRYQQGRAEEAQGDPAAGRQAAGPAGRPEEARRQEAR